jgi:hypothetical protein
MRGIYFTLALLSTSVGTHFASAAPAVDPATRAKVTAQYLQSPMIFEMNEGQSDPRVKALSRGSKYGLFLTSNESVFVLNSGAKNPSVVQVRAVGANATPKVSGVDRLGSVSNYFLGKDQSKWRKNVANYERVKYESIYPGVDLIYYGNQKQLEYDYVVAPGADPDSIRLDIEGASKLKLDRNGDLLLETSDGAITQHKPVIYQQVDGTRRQIAGNFVVRGKQVSFQVGDYDHSKKLVIDPSFDFVTYLGGSGTDQGLGITITTATGLTLVAGSTASANFPIVPAPVCADPPMPDPVCTQTGVTSYPYTGETDGFMATFNPSGTKLFNTTYVGGSGGINVVTSVAIDNYEDPELLYVAGYTTSKDFDVVNAAQPTIGGGTDGWVAQILLDLTITSFVPPEGIINTSVGFATYLGGSGTDEITGLTIDQNTKDVFVTGFTTSTNFPVTAGAFQTTRSGTEDAFVVRYASGCTSSFFDGCTPETTPAGTKLYATYFGGTGAASVVTASGIAVFTSPTTGDLTAYISGTSTGTLKGPNEPAEAHVVTPAAIPVATPAATTESFGFMAAIGANGTTNPFTKYVGSATTITKANAITTDCNGYIYITGSTTDADLTVLAPIYKHYQGGDSDVFIAIYNSSGKETMLSYFGGKGTDVATQIGVFLTPANFPATCTTEPMINLFVAGHTTGSFPIVVPTGSSVPQATYGGGPTDGFVFMITSDNYAHFTEGCVVISGANTCSYSTYVGGPGSDLIYGMAIGSSGNARITGITNSTSGMATTGAYQTTIGGGYDAFAAEILTTP